MMGMKRCISWLLTAFLLCSVHVCAGESQTPCVAWMEYTIHEETARAIWREMQCNRAGRIEKGLLLAEDEEGFFITHSAHPADLCLAIHTIGLDDYTIYRYQDGTLYPLFSVRCPEAFAFLAFRDRTVTYAQEYRLFDDLLKTFVILEQTADTSREILRYQSDYWYRPSINAKGEILYAVAQEQDETIWLHTLQGDTEITSGEFPVWYSETSFLFVRDEALWQYDLTRMMAKPWETQAGEGVPVALNPFSGDGLYLTADGEYLVYGVLLEEKWLGFISSGYYYKAWQVVSLQTGKEYRVGRLEESYDNVYVH